MASEHKCKAELSKTNTEEAETEQFASRPSFEAFHEISNREVVKDEAPEIEPFTESGNEQNEGRNQFGAAHILNVEIVDKDPTEIKPFSGYGLFNDSLDENGKERFYEPDSNEFEVMQSTTVEESKYCPTNFLENMNFNGFADEWAKPKVNYFDNGVISKNEDEDCTDDLSTNNVESKMERLKTECDIDIVYENVKFQICEEKSSGKNDKVLGTEIETDFSRELSKDSETWPQQNIEEDGISVERDNNTRKEPTSTIDSKNSQMIQKLPHCKYHPKCYLFESKQEFKNRYHTGGEPFQCNACQKRFAVKSNLLRHERIHTIEKPFQCKICSKSFTVNDKRLTHERMHTRGKTFQCKICSKSFSHKGHHTVHERIHTGEKPFQCKICLRSFIEKHKLLVHERIHTGEKSFHCQICSKSFSCKGDHTVHERSHTGEQHFQCKICLKTFAGKHKLLVHERIHTGEKPFQCKMCLKSFSCKGNLTVHERIHTGDEPFQCKICLKSFSFKGHLMVHERIHTGEKPFQCEICSKSFSQKGYLTGHKRSHTGERPFECKVCPKSFALKSTLLKHERIHTGKKPFHAKIIQRVL